jgi:biopolymer transport protein ExbD
MLLASIGSWYLIVTKGVLVFRMRRKSEAFLAAFWEAPNLEAVASRIRESGTTEPFSHLVHHGFTAIEQHNRCKNGCECDNTALINAGAPDDLLTHSVKIDLPKASSTANLTKPDNVQLAIDAASQVFWNGKAISGEQFAERLKAASALQPQPELHIRAERTTPYEKVAQVMSEAAKQGLVRIGFVTDPGAAGR